MDCIVRGVAKSWTRLSDFHFHFSLSLETNDIWNSEDFQGGTECGVRKRDRFLGMCEHEVRGGDDKTHSFTQHVALRTAWPFTVACRLKVVWWAPSAVCRAQAWQGRWILSNWSLNG